MVGGRIRSAARKLPLYQVGAGAGALAFAVSGLFGGFAGTDSTAVASPGTPVAEGGPWRVTVTKVRLYNDLPSLAMQKTGDRWVLVLATVEVTAADSRQDTRDILTLDGVP